MIPLHSDDSSDQNRPLRKIPSSLNCRPGSASCKASNVANDPKCNKGPISVISFGRKCNEGPMCNKRLALNVVNKSRNSSSRIIV